MNSSISLSHRAHFSELLLSMEHDFGTRATCRDFLQGLRKALLITTLKNTADLRSRFLEFYDIYLHLKPRMAIIQHYLDGILRTLSEHEHE